MCTVSHVCVRVYVFLCVCSVTYTSKCSHTLLRQGIKAGNMNGTRELILLGIQEFESLSQVPQPESQKMCLTSSCLVCLYSSTMRSMLSIMPLSEVQRRLKVSFRRVASRRRSTLRYSSSSGLKRVGYSHNVLKVSKSHSLMYRACTSECIMGFIVGDTPPH